MIIIIFACLLIINKCQLYFDHQTISYQSTLNGIICHSHLRRDNAMVKILY